MRAGPAGRGALLLIALSVLLQVVVGALGPSVAVPPLSPAQAGHSLAQPELVTALLVLALTAGTAGLLLGLHALRTGWRPRPGRLLAFAAVAVIALLAGPPLGTADLGGYAAYGRMVVLGENPYKTTARELAGDPVVDAAEDPWRDVRSIYGPAATAEFWAVAELGGNSRQAVLRGLAVCAGLAFVGTGLLLDRLAAGGPAGENRRRRAALLWSLNPLLLHQLVAAAHLDGLVTLIVVSGVALAGSRAAGSPLASRASRAGRAVLSGALLGLSTLVKATAFAPALGLAFFHQASGATRRSRLRQLACYAAAGLGVAAAGYLAAGGFSALQPTRDASRYVSRGTPWRFVASGLEQVLPFSLARTLVGLLALAVAAALAVRLHRSLAPASSPASAAARMAFLAGLAWLLVAPYSLPWYDALAWGLLALLNVVSVPDGPRPALERLLTVHTAVLSVAYLPGRVVGLPDGILTAQDVVRGVVAPLVVLGVILAAARLPRQDSPTDRAPRGVSRTNDRGSGGPKPLPGPAGQ